MKKLIVLLSLQVLFSQVPHKMSFQAYLTDANNMPVAPGSYEMTFRIYDALTEGNKLWEETQTVTVDGSLVSLMLGNTVPLVTLKSAGYLEIQLKDDILSPRQELGASMFSLQADKALNADKAIKADTANIAVGYAKLDTLAVYAKTADIAANTDNQTLRISGDTLYVSGGNNAVLSPYKDNTDTQDLSYNLSTKVLSLTDGGTVDLSGLAAASSGNNISDADADTKVQVEEASDEDKIRFDTGGSERMIIDNSGNVGIGTSTPSSLLDIKAGNTSDVLLHLAKYGNDSKQLVIGNTNQPNHEWFFRVDNTSHFSLNKDTISTPYLFINTNTSNVGIGSSSPGSKLDVKGTLRLSGSTDGYVGIKGAASAGSTTYTLPSSDGSNGQVLKTNGSGTLSWATSSGATSVSGLTDALVEDNSMYLGNDPSSTTSTAEYNIAIGTTALDAVTTGDDNVAVGYDALSANTTGHSSIAIGRDALIKSTTASWNTAVGDSAMTENTTGWGNTVIGAKALGNNTTGSGNIAVGGDALRANTTANYNSALGAFALTANTTASNNTAVGYAALVSNTTAPENTAVGYASLYSNTTGQYNTAVGSVSLPANTTASANTAIGYASLYSNTTGYNNSSVGFQAMASNTTGENNTAVGVSALQENTTGEMNAAFGETSLKSNTTGDRNTAIGTTSLEANTTGSYNTAVGTGAGDVITTGSSNVILGDGADPSGATGANQIVIGKGATGQGDNYAVIGNADITRLYAAQDGAGVLYANGTIQSSDRRIKHSISDIPYGLSYIMKLRPVSYYKKQPKDYSQELKDKFYPDGNVREVASEDYNKLQVGFIAQEVKAVNDELDAENNIVTIDEDGFHRMDYEKLVVPMVKAIQELTARIEKLENQLEANGIDVSASQ